MVLHQRLQFPRLLLAFSLVLLAGTARAQTVEPPERVSVLTMGPGDHPFARFGHNAILLEWPGPSGGQTGKGAALVYNYGTFAFSGLGGVSDFMTGKFRYWLSASSLDETLAAYARQRRTLVAQELDLTRNERGRLAQALADNARPDRRFYDYDYYLDNCSTRVRDVLDELLQGGLKRAAHGPGRLSFRGHTLRLTAGTIWVYAGLDLALGAPTDRPTTRWQELFLPSELHDVLAATTREQAGRTTSLVRNERVLLRAARPQLPGSPPERSTGFAIVGLSLGAVLAGLGALAASYRAARLSFSLLCGALGVSLGLLGCVFFGFWAFSRHWSAHENANLLLCPPLALALSVLCVGLGAGRAKATRRAQQVVTLCLVTSAIALALAMMPNGQDNLRMALLLFPVWGGLWLGLRRLEQEPARAQKPVGAASSEREGTEAPPGAQPRSSASAGMK